MTRFIERPSRPQRSCAGWGTDNHFATVVQEIAAKGEHLKGMGDKDGAAGKKFLFATVADVGLGTDAVKTAADFDSHMSKASANSGATGDGWAS